MAYAIVGYFDSITDLFIKSIWKELADNDICNYLYNSENNPHIKFLMFEELELDNVVPILYDFTQKHKKIDVHLKTMVFSPMTLPLCLLIFLRQFNFFNLRVTFKTY